jgi:type IV fimbrial biogenesis protein FimT
MLRTPPKRGFTLIELLVGLSIVGIVLAIGAPSFATYLQGSKLAHAAQSYLAGIQLARAEAIRRNLPVEFVLTDVPLAPGLENVGGIENANGRNWLVRVFNPAAAAFDLIEEKSALEGGYTSTGAPSIVVAGNATAPAVFNGILTFNGFGATTTQSAYVFDLQNPSGGACAPAGPMRCPRIRVAAGGQALVCDVNVPVGDSRAC